MTSRGETITPAYVARYHEDRPGITEDLLERLVDPGTAPERPYDWLATALPEDGPVLDIACGSTPLAVRAGDRGYVGVDRSAAELARARRRSRPPDVVLGDACHLPVRGPSGAVTVSMALMLVEPLEDLLTEVARVLRPGGVLTALVPAAGQAEPRPDPVLLRVLTTLGRSATSFPEPLDPAGLGVRVAAAGLRLVHDETRRFTFRLHDEADATLLVRSFYAPSARPGDVRHAIDDVVASTAGGPLDVGYPLRRLVARSEAASGRGW